MIRKLLASFALAVLVLCSGPMTVHAASPLNGACNGSAAQSAVCQDSQGGGKNPLTGGDGLFMKITNIIAIFAGIAAVIIILLAGMRFVTSGGSSEDVAGARRTITYALIGLIVIALARALIGLILSKL